MIAANPTPTCTEPGSTHVIDSHEHVVAPHERIQPDKISEAIGHSGNEFVVCRSAFRWMRDGQVIPNAYESFSLQGICEDNGWSIVCQYGDSLAVLREGPGPLPEPTRWNLAELTSSDLDQLEKAIAEQRSRGVGVGPA